MRCGASYCCRQLEVKITVELWQMGENMPQTYPKGWWSTYSQSLHLPLVKDCFWGIAPTLPAWHTHTEPTLNNKNPSGREPQVCTASHQCCVCSSAKSICVSHSPCQIHRLYAIYATTKLKPMLTTSSSLFHHQWLFSKQDTLHPLFKMTSTTWILYHKHGKLLER